MPVRFDPNIANALVRGAAIPIDVVMSFCQDAYDSFAQLQSLSDRLKDKEGELSKKLSKIASLHKEIEGLKALLAERG